MAEVYQRADTLNSVRPTAEPDRAEFIMLRMIALIVLSGMLCVVDRARAEQSVDALLDIAGSPQPIRFEDRQAAKDALIARPYTEVLPKLAVRISQAPPEWSSRILMSSTGSGLGDENSPPGEQAICALEAVWSADTYGPKPPTFAPDLVRYLAQPEFCALRSRLVAELSTYWCAAAEQPVERIFYDVKEPVQLRSEAAYTLNQHARQKNLDALITFAQAQPERDAYFLMLRLIEANGPWPPHNPQETRMLVFTHDLMEKEVRRTGHVSDGYFHALMMGDLIALQGAPPNAGALPNPFAASLDAPGMMGEHGASDLFFRTPVERARQWWALNGESLCSPATQSTR